MRRRHINVAAQSRASVGEVFGLLANGASWPSWSPIESFELERPGTTAPEGSGAIRVFRRGRTTGRDEILEVIPNRRLSYASLSWLPVGNYRAEVDLEATDTRGGHSLAFFVRSRGLGDGVDPRMWHSSFPSSNVREGLPNMRRHRARRTHGGQIRGRLLPAHALRPRDPTGGADGRAGGLICDLRHLQQQQEGTS